MSDGTFLTRGDMSGAKCTRGRQPAVILLVIPLRSHDKKLLIYCMCVCDWHDKVINLLYDKFVTSSLVMKVARVSYSYG